MTAPISTAVPAVNMLQQTRPSRLHRDLLFQIAGCAAVPMTLVGLSQFTLAAYLLFVSVCMVLAYYILSHQGLKALTVIAGLIPATMLLRGLFIYNAPPIMMAGCLLVALESRQERRRAMDNKPLVWFMGASFLYWFTSVILTGDYVSNSRMIEFALAACTVYVLAGHRSFLATALLGILISALALAGGLLPHGVRLGTTNVSRGITVGNPIALGLSAALGYLFTIADRGRWLLLHDRPLVRIALNLAAGLPLVLSTSRGSWLVTIIGLGATLILNRGARKPVLICVAIMALLIAAILRTDRGPIIQHYFDNAVGDEKSLDKRTTGRADQWQSFPQVLDESSLWGFGPGSGKSVSLKYTKDGKPWHSLYLLIGAETGVLGLGLLATLLTILLRKSIRHRREFGEVGPLIGCLSLMFIGVSVSGLDAISGVFLGLAFIAGDRSGFRMMRIVRVGEPDMSKAAVA